MNKLPWVEKYRPSKLEQVADHVDIIDVMRNIVKTGDMPHMILYGPPGTGKTSSIISLVNELYGNKVKDRILELNASDDRGIETVRQTIKDFLKISIYNEGPEVLNFNIVILDEADTMTAEAQGALRKNIEKYSPKIRFCFICNYINKIIEPIVSRCIKLKFKPISKLTLTNKLKFIAEKENMIINDECLEEIIMASGGDARSAIMTLQNMNYIYMTKKCLEVNDIKRFNGWAGTEKYNEIINICSTKNKKSIMGLARSVCNSGYDIKNILVSISKLIFNFCPKKLSDDKKINIIMKICSLDKNISDGCTEYLQLLNCFLFISDNL